MLIVLSGPAATGKTTYAREWLVGDPATRRSAHSIASASELLCQGFDVVIDLEGGSPIPALDHPALDDFNILVKRFTYDPAPRH